MFRASVYAFLLITLLTTTASAFEFGIEENKKIGKAYGREFGAKFFVNRVLHNERNREVRLRSLARIQENNANRQLIELSRHDFAVVVSMGLGWDSHLQSNTAPYVHDFVRDIQGMGVKVYFLEHENYGAIESNVSMLIPQLKKIAAVEKKIVFLSLCKGSPELLLAWSRVLAKNPESQSQVVGYLNLSGMMTGTYWSDAFGDSNLLGFVGYELEQSKNGKALETGLTVGALPTMTTEKIKNALDEAAAHIPKDMFVITVVGAPTDYNFLKKGSALGPFIKANNVFNIYDGANDGFLDLTQVPFPDFLNSNQVILTFNSSHLLADGSFGPFDLTHRRDRTQVYRSLIQEVIEGGKWN